jgi:hypothetical protein
MKKPKKSIKNNCGRWILSAGKHTGCSEGGSIENNQGIYHAEKRRNDFKAVQFVA